MHTGVRANPVSVKQAENVLLHWEENSLLPTCKLSDFGSASSDAYHRERSTFSVLI